MLRRAVNCWSLQLKFIMACGGSEDINPGHLLPVEMAKEAAKLSVLLYVLSYCVEEAWAM